MYNYTKTIIHLRLSEFTSRLRGIIVNYFLSMRMEQSDWLIRLSQRAVFLHPGRMQKNGSQRFGCISQRAGCISQRAAVKCNRPAVKCNRLAVKYNRTSAKNCK